ncbi:MAG: 30S ribosomal protein S18 [bacterium]|nr:30S ribosomal protein S18 [bacterium]
MKSHSNLKNNKNRRTNRRPIAVKPKQCQFCTTNTKLIDYKDRDTLKPFMSPQARIQGRKRTGLCALHQRQLGSAIKRGRIMGVVPFTLR